MDTGTPTMRGSSSTGVSSRVSRSRGTATGSGSPATPRTWTQVVAVQRGTEFKEIVAAVERWKVTAVPVVEGEGRVVGVVSEADLLLKEEFHDHRLGLVEQMRRLDATAKAGSRRAEDLMTSPAVTVAPGAALTLSGEVRDSALIPLAAHLARAVEGVVGVRCELTAPGRT
ncbi:CBS domain-containing protein [Streptomyces sp. MSC1_001]|uniref:CBS domain-containing protein n=1 Tax=Streptomyces sp. MSC1_001 TaxID=2909263 RepID=UPI0027E56AE1|nr:CBS domain-containing protein [Streptomyces sp. MSC1_001]